MNNGERARTPSLSGKLAFWWLNALPPLNGPLRLAFYLLLIVTIFTHVGDPLLAPELIRARPTILYMPVGIPGLFGVWPDPSWLAVIRWLTLGAWLCAAVGLFWRLTSIVTAVGFFVLAGAWGTYDFYRGTLLPLFALVFLCFASCDDRWTADAHIAKRWPGYWFNPSPSGTVSRTGFARALVTVAAFFMMFAAGTTKLRDGGFRWMDGQTLQQLLSRGEAPVAVLTGFRHFVGAHSSLCALLAVFTIVAEAGSPIGLVSTRMRHVFALLGTALHLGIVTLFGPNFLQWLAVYVLIVDWGDPLGRAKRAEPATISARWPVTVAMGTVGVFLIVCLLRIEFWPFSFMPMFASYKTAREINGIPIEKFGEADTIQPLAVECARGISRRGTWLGTCPTSFWPQFVIRAGYRLAGEPSCKVTLTDKDLGAEWHEGSSVQAALHGRVANSEHGSWLWVTAFASIQGLAAKPPGRLNEDMGPDDWANRFVRDMVPFVAAIAAKHPDCTRLEMTFALKQGPVVIASAPLVGGHPGPQWASGLVLEPNWPIVEK